MIASLRALLLRPFLKYNDWLERKPVLTKSLTSGVMYATGDALAQKAEHYVASKGGGGEASSSAVKPKFSMNWKRLGIFFIYGTVIAGPSYHLWFSRLDLLPAAMLQLRAHRQRAEVLRAYALLKRHGIEVNLRLEKVSERDEILGAAAMPISHLKAPTAAVMWTSLDAHQPRCERVFMPVYFLGSTPFQAHPFAGHSRILGLQNLAMPQQQRDLCAIAARPLSHFCFRHKRSKIPAAVAERQAVPQVGRQGDEDCRGSVHFFISLHAHLFHVCRLYDGRR